MNWLPEHKFGLYLSNNHHKLIGETIQECYDAKDFVSPEEYIKAIDENSVWVLGWYPETPIGYHVMAASSLQAIEDAIERAHGIGEKE